MAAFEGVSKIVLRPHNTTDELLDITTARLPRETPPDDGFDPREHRDPRNPIKTWMAYFNILRTGFGAGMLGMPLAISQTGLVMGPILSMCIGILLIHTHLTLLRCLNEVSRQLKIPYISYRYGFRLALLRGPPVFHPLGRRGPTVIATFMILSQIGICTVFVIFTTDSLRDIMDWKSARTSLYVMFIPYVILQVAMKSLTVVSYSSMIGNVFNAVGMGILFYHIFKDPHGETIYANDRILQYLFSVGFILFLSSSVGVVLSMEKALENPKAMTDRFGVVSLGMGTICVVATIIGTLGYWSFGAMEENVLRSLPYDDDSAMAVIGLYMLSVAFAFPIQCYPAIQIVIEVLKNHDPLNVPSDTTLKIIEQIARPCFVLLCFVICYLIPFQGPFVAFVGNLCTTILAIVFPSLMDLCLRYPKEYGRYNLHLFKSLIIIILALISWVFGVGFSGYVIYIRLLSMQSPNDDEYL